MSEPLPGAADLPATSTTPGQTPDDASRDRTIGLIAAGAVVVGALLPWASVTTIFGTISKAGIDGDGVITLILGAAAAAGIWIGGKGRMVAIISGALTLAIAAYDIIDVVSTDSEDGLSVSVGLGLWLTLLAGIVLTVFAVRLRRHPA